MVFLLIRLEGIFVYIDTIIAIYNPHTMKSTTFPLNISPLNSIWQSSLGDAEHSKISYFNLNNVLLDEVLRIQQLGLVIWSPDSDEYGLLLGDLQNVCGWSNDYLKNVGPEAFLSHLVSSSFKGLCSLIKHMNTYLMSISESQLPHFKAIYDYELIGKDGKIRRICQENSIFTLDKNSKVQYFLSCISNISNVKRDGKQHLFLTGSSKEMLIEIDQLTNVCTELQLLTTRELEIARFMGKGLQSEEISELLNIALTTVYKHRQNILQKLKMQDTSEALHLLKTLKMI